MFNTLNAIAVPWELPVLQKYQGNFVFPNNIWIMDNLFFLPSQKLNGWQQQHWICKIPIFQNPIKCVDIVDRKGWWGAPRYAHRATNQRLLGQVMEVTLFVLHCCSSKNCSYCCRPVWSFVSSNKLVLFSGICLFFYTI